MKYRKKLLLETELITFLKTICFEIGERHCFEFDAIGSDGDYVHLFVGAEPKYSPSRVMQTIKSITARHIWLFAVSSGKFTSISNYGSSLHKI